MGISCASEIFTEAIRVILEKCLGQVNMTNDILVFGKSAEEHHVNLLRVLKTLEKAGITLNRQKCEFYKENLTFFGLQFSSKGVAPTHDRCAALRNAKTPTDAKGLLSFLGMAGYSNRFIRDMQSITEPLRHLTRASVKWRWTEVEQQAFDKLKHSISENCFAYFDKTWDTEVHVDASPVGLSAVLVQVDPDNKSERRFVMVTSRQLTDVEKRYSQFEKEALAAVWGCERLWIYLLGHRFKLVTDNRAIQLIFANSASN